MPVTGFYAGLLALILLFLGARVSGARMKTGISILHGDDLDLADRIRRHANFAEHVPMALLLLGIVELGGARPLVLHLLGGVLVVARVLHPLGVRHDVIPHPLRAIGAGATFLVTLAAACITIGQLAARL